MNVLFSTALAGTRTSFTSITQDGMNIQDNSIRSNATDFVPNRPVVDQIAEFSITELEVSCSIELPGTRISR
jgi:hypothetical protein